jgi:hypothetical protein
LNADAFEARLKREDQQKKNFIRYSEIAGENATAVDSNPTRMLDLSHDEIILQRRVHVISFITVMNSMKRMQN